MFIRVVFVLAVMAFATTAGAQPVPISETKAPMEVKILQDNGTTMVALVPAHTNSRAKASVIMGKMREVAERVCRGNCTKTQVEMVKDHLSKKGISVIKVEVRKP